MWNLKISDTNELTYKTERDRQKTNLWLPGWGWERKEQLGICGRSFGEGTHCYIENG